MQVQKPLPMVGHPLKQGAFFGNRQVRWRQLQLLPELLHILRLSQNPIGVGKEAISGHLNSVSSTDCLKNPFGDIGSSSIGNPAITG